MMTSQSTKQEEIACLWEFAEGQAGIGSRLKQLLSDELLRWFEEQVDSGQDCDIHAKMMAKEERFQETWADCQKMQDERDKAQRKADDLLVALRNVDYFFSNEMRKRKRAEDRIKAIKAERNDERKKADFYCDESHRWCEASDDAEARAGELARRIDDLEHAVLRLAILTEQGGQDAGPALKELDA